MVMPKSVLVRILYIALAAIGAILLIVCLGATVWAATAEDGWVTINAFMIACWVLSSPFILGAIAWSIILFVGGNTNKQASSMEG
ncbi:hypothetical protein [Brevibacterium aurantiacum]|uniref:Uncharacterized protein n=1 Tax=Brevibacterium aurantiacum TaxID=273384 RepID=A0A3Q9P2S5_BREAU|nr:hypothetical protein [Brevibacterium aurantiacum]AZL10196.1 hypothetical protein CXR26_13935 [Brevibacterium aurantiacum]AZT94416.1 hypothetical protein CXR23_15735 [Brevibacterium aurantiacum]AZT98181.1 hypothetical protein CXR27_15150 [Brevibacterium aurantiacum]RCS94951.1 hypothetical protein CIK60_17625 [Brevibacterium aurantiacum]